MNQELRDKVKIWHKKHRFSVPELIERKKIQQSIRFDSPEDVDFELMDFFFGGMLSRILKHAGVCAYAYKNWGRAYEEFKPYVSDYVGLDSIVTTKKDQPKLHSKEAYELMMNMLSKTCYRCADKRRMKRRQMYK